MDCEQIDAFYTETFYIRDKIEQYRKWKNSEARKSVWTCKNNNKVQIRNMSVSHLKNTIKLLQVKEPDHNALPYLKQELEYRQNYTDYLEYLDYMEFVEEMAL